MIAAKTRDSSLPVARNAPKSALRRRRFPYLLVASLMIAGASMPLALDLVQPKPWLAAVDLSAAGGQADGAAFQAAARKIISPQSLGQAVDLLNLDKDPEFTGGESSALKVALELLAGEGADQTDLRRKAMDALAGKTSLSIAERGAAAILLVRASSTEKARKIGEALAAISVSSVETTGAIGNASDAALERLEKAEAVLGEFRASAGDDKLSAALVLQQRINGLQKHIGALNDAEKGDQPALAKATLNDVLSGRVPVKISDARLESLRQAYVAAKLDADALAVSLGPKHPRLVSARKEAEAQRGALSDQLAAVKKQYAQKLEDDQRARSSLLASLRDLEKQRASLGVDLSAYNKLSSDLKEARGAYDKALAQPDKITTASVPLLNASAPRALPVSSELAIEWRILLGGISGLGAALAFVLAFRGSALRERQASGGGLEVERSLSPAPVPVAPIPPRAIADVQDLAPVAAIDASLFEMEAMLSLAEVPETGKTLPEPRYRTHQPANGHLPARNTIAIQPVYPVHSRADVTMVEKLRRVAPHVFADEQTPIHPGQDPTAEISRLREELAGLRHRILQQQGLAFVDIYAPATRNPAARALRR